MPRPREKAKDQATTAKPIHQVKITLKWSDPAIWRRVLVDGDTSLGELHGVIQAVMGWGNSHLHQFIVGPARSPVYLGSVDPWFGMDDGSVLPEEDFTVAAIAVQAKRKFGYEYDFGDGWLHEIKVEKLLPVDPALKYPLCIAGENACPPDDCGGIGGYYRMLEILADPKDAEHGDWKDWVPRGFDPLKFDLARANARLR
jgi:hypothetical protein